MSKSADKITDSAPLPSPPPAMPVPQQALPTKPDRPSVLGGVTIKVTTGCGNMYVQLNWYHGKLFEVFATLGHGGGCAVCQSEAITRSITLGLKYGIPLIEYTRQLRQIRCPSPVPFPRESAVTSCPDAIAVTLERYGTLDIQAVVGLLLGVNGHGKSEDDEETVMARMVELDQERRRQGI